MKTVGRMERWDMKPMPAFSDPSELESAGQTLMHPAMNGPSTLEPPLQLGVMASGNGSNFEALVQAIERGELPAQIRLLVVNNPGCGAQHRADRLGIPWAVVDHRIHRNREDLDRELVQCFRSAEVESVVMAGWMRIVTNELIQAFPQRLLNIHPSLLPSFKGLDGVGQALAAGVKISGCSVHLVTEDLDAGPIIAQAAVPVFPEDDHASLAKRIQVQEHRLLPHAIRLIGATWRQG